MDISIIGASGGCGREVASQLIRDRVLGPQEILQLVGSNPNTSRPHLLTGLRADLQDAFDEYIPEIDVTHNPEDIIGDIVVMTGGVTLGTSPKVAGKPPRDLLAEGNAKVFHRFAKAIAENRPENPPIVIIVSNPVEYAVKIFSQYLPRENVIGMGAYSDSSRFRREIAHDLGIRRQRVQGYVLGEHGPGIVPLWSTVKIQGMTEAEWELAEQKLRKGHKTADFPQELKESQAIFLEYLLNDKENGPERALEYVKKLPPDLRVALKPLAIHYTQSKTQHATGTATVELVKAVAEGRRVEVAAQYLHQGENDFFGPFGAPVILAGNVQRVSQPLDITEEERKLLERASRLINDKIEQWEAASV